MNSGALGNFRIMTLSSSWKNDKCSMHPLTHYLGLYDYRIESNGKRRKWSSQKGENADDLGRNSRIFPKAHRVVPGGPPGQHNSECCDKYLVIRTKRTKPWDDIMTA